jgi:hypothetical protein
MRPAVYETAALLFPILDRPKEKSQPNRLEDRCSIISSNPQSPRGATAT